MNQTGERLERLQAGDQDAGRRLDIFLAEHLPDHSRSEISRWIGAGTVTIQGKPVRAARRLRAGEEVYLQIPAPRAMDLEPESIPLDVLFEDDHILVLSKAPHMVVHPGAGVRTGTLVHALLARGERWSTIGGVHRPGIVHRLDRTTSGVMVVARTDAAHRNLSLQFSQREVSKHYRAVVYGCPKAARGLIDAPIGRHAARRARMAVRDEGRPARTRYRIQERFDGFSLLVIELLTGRTHQIRVHLSELGHPLVGDLLYGAPLKAPQTPAGAAVEQFERVALHAEILAFHHPLSGEPLSFTAPLPTDFQVLVAALRTAGP
ncbi:MAG: RluA family pseudouridine synthase [Acidobacteria bacterium]|nr:MAG: RluA family pseudouridine synthase [Acidobacteriota bacterium]